MSIISAGGRPPQLDDPDWLRAHAHHGQLWISLELGIGRKAVRNALARHGIRSLPGGRPRGATSLHAVGRPRAIDRIADRIEDEQQDDGPAPMMSLLAARVRAVHDAEQHRDRLGLEDALVSLACACGLILDHLQALRAA